MFLGKQLITSRAKQSYALKAVSTAGGPARSKHSGRVRGDTQEIMIKKKKKRRRESCDSTLTERWAALIDPLLAGVGGLLRAAAAQTA